MNLSAVWSRLSSVAGSHRRMNPALVLLAMCGGVLALLFLTANRFGRIDRVPLDADTKFTAADFQTAQSEWKNQGLTAARFAAGVIQVPADQLEQYREAWRPSDSADERSRWADVWQQANDRLSQFSSSRERDAAREISRAQVVSRLLEDMPDVESADIVWDEGTSQGWREAQRVRATVYLQAAAGRSIGPDVVDAVRKAVSGSKANLAPEDVTVMDQTRMVTYGANDTSLVDVRTAQLVAQFRTRLTGAFEHISGVRVEVHANAVAAESAAAPVIVGIGVPEESLRALANLDAEPDADAPAQQRHRDVFRRVEQHVHRSVTSRVQQLIPAGLTLAAPEHLVVETLPSPPAAVKSRATIVSPELAAWLQQHGLIVIAACCGVGAISMLRPRRRPAREAVVVETTSADALPMESDRPLFNTPAQGAATPFSLSPERLPVSSATAPPSAVTDQQAVGESAGTELSATTTSGVDAAVGPAEGSHSPPNQTTLTGEVASTSPASESTAAGATTTGRLATRTDLLRDVLTRLDQQRVHSSGRTRMTTSADESATDEAAEAQVFSARTTGRLLTNQHWETLDLEQLRQEDPSILRALVQSVEVEVWLRALFGASSELRGRILPCLPPDQARQLTAGLESKRPVRLREIDAAQQEVFGAWTRLRQIPPLDIRVPALAAPRRPAA